MNRPRHLALVALFLLLAFKTVAHAEDSEPRRPKLQILNGSPEGVEIFWLKSETERVPRGMLEPGKARILSTTLGHRFDIVGPDGLAAMCREGVRRNGNRLHQTRHPAHRSHGRLRPRQRADVHLAPAAHRCAKANGQIQGKYGIT